MSIRTWLTERLFGNEIQNQISLAVRALDDSRDRMVSRSTFPRDRHGYDRDEVLEDALEAWRVNPLARRVGVNVSVRGWRRAGCRSEAQKNQ